jgi:hypothetical protein
MSLPLGPHAKDITGQTFGLLTAIRPAGRARRAVTWLCRCACGRDHVANGPQLRNGETTNCGCVREANSHQPRDITCAVCGKPFQIEYTVAIGRKPKYCSKGCLAEDKRRLAAERLETRFWAKVDQRGPDECWPWAGAKTRPWGYGRININGKVEHANRVAYTLARGAIPADKIVCHSCDNPGCCNPNHLWLGTHRENAEDRDAKGRRRLAPQRGDDHPTRKLCSDDVRRIRASVRPNRELAEQYGVTTTQIRNILSGRHWRHV